MHISDARWSSLVLSTGSHAASCSCQLQLDLTCKQPRNTLSARRNCLGTGMSHRRWFQMCSK